MLCGWYRRKYRICHQNYRGKRNEMPDFSLGNYAFFGVDEPATCGGGASQYLFAIAACCNANTRPLGGDAERGGSNTPGSRNGALTPSLCPSVVLCIKASLASPHGYTP